MRIAIVDPYYQRFLDSHYAERPELADAPYAEQHAALMARFMGTGDAYSHHLRRLGHDVVELVPNAVPLQAAWAREHAAARLTGSLRRLPAALGRLGRQVFQHELVGRQIDEFGAQVVYVQDMWFFRRAELDRMRRAGRLVVGQIASKPPPESVLTGYDLVLTSFPHFVERFRAAGVACEYFPIAFDERIDPRLAAEGVRTDAGGHRPHGVVFAGGLDATEHPGRVALVERLAERVDLEIWGYGRESLPPGSPILERHQGELWGLDMYRLFARSRIVLNSHIESAEGFANNMRLYEATGTGSLLLTDAAPNLGELFEPGREVVAYTDSEDAAVRAERLLADDAERIAIAAAGRGRTLAEHTYEHRIPELAAMLEERLR